MKSRYCSFVKRGWRFLALSTTFVLLTIQVFANVNISLSPANPSISVGNTFTVEVRVEFKGGSLDAAEAHLNFDKTYLQVVSVTRSALSILPTEPLPLSSIAAMNASGQIGYAAGTTSNFPSGNFVFLTIEFQAIQAGTTPITFNTIFQRKTDAQRLFTSILAGVSNANVTITALLTCFEDQTTAHFSLGSPDGNIYLSPHGDGEIILNPNRVAEFDVLPSNTQWASYPWNVGGSSTILGGQLIVDGARFNMEPPELPLQFAAGVEFVATFGGAPFQSIGFGGGNNFSPSEIFNSSPWAIFSTGITGTSLQARIWNGTNVSDIDILGSSGLLGMPHRYRIEWDNQKTNFFIDGVLVHTETTAIITAPMRVAISDFSVGGTNVSVDWIRILPYATSGTFTSRVYNGGTATNWGIASWTAITPIGTSLQLLQRQGNTPTPDGTWTNFTLIPSNGAIVGGTSHYIQYQAVLTTTNPNQTPVLQDVSISCSSAGCATLTSSDVNNAICTGESVTFTASPTGGNYEFFLNGNSIQNGASNLYTTIGLNNGDQVYVIVTNAGGCSGTSSTITTIVSTPPTVSISPLTSTICPGQPANLSVNITGGTPPYSVDISNGTTTTAYLFANSGVSPILPAPMPSVTTTYTIQSITDIAGCEGDINVASATVNVANISAVLQAPPVNPCAGDPITLGVNITGGTVPYTAVINNRTYTNITNEVTITPPFSIWSDSEIPAQPANDDNQPTASSPIEVGTRFQATVNGLVTGIRFYKGWTLAETYTVNLYSNDGSTLIATAGAALDATTGWRVINFSTPIFINANTTYVVALFSPTGSYAFTGNYFTTSINRLPLIGLQDGFDGANAVFRYGGGFPTSTFNSSSYWVDVVFVPNTTATFNLTSVTDANGCTLTGNPISSVTVTIDPNCGTYPIELLSFTGWRDQDVIQLYWEVATQKDNDYMAVERSKDGIHFVEIGRVKGAGTTTELRAYKLTDPQPLPGINYYRLRQVDLDGTVNYHRVIAIPFDSKINRVRLFPNPASQQLTIQLEQPSEEDGVVQITDLLGRPVQRFNFPRGSAAEVVNLKDFANGTYILSLESRSAIFKEKFVKSTN